MRRGTRTALGAVLLSVAGLIAQPATVSAGTVSDQSVSVDVTASTRRFQAPGAAEEQAFVDKINALRTSKGLAPLAIDGQLTTQARIWAETMREQGHIFHSQTLAQGIDADWQKLGENVGVGPTVDDLFAAFVASPKHYENLVDPKYRFVGIGVVWDGAEMYTAHRFMGVFPEGQSGSLPPTTQPPAPKPPKPPASTAAPTTTPKTTPVTAPPTLAPTTIPPVTTAPPPLIPDELAAIDPANAPTEPPSADPQRVTLILTALGRAFT